MFEYNALKDLCKKGRKIICYNFSNIIFCCYSPTGTMPPFSKIKVLENILSFNEMFSAIFFYFIQQYE